MELNSCNLLFSRVFPFWSELTDNQKADLCSNVSETSYKKGSLIHGGGSVCTGGILIKTGGARVYLMSDEGKEVTLYRLYPGDMCMLSASCVIESITFDVFVEAFDDTECYIVGGNAFSKLAAENVNVKNYALSVVVERFSDVIWAMQQILFMSFDKRLAVFLYDESVKRNSLTISITQEEIASLMGSAREVVSRMLKYFSAEGIVKTVRGGVEIINKDKLKSLAQH